MIKDGILLINKPIDFTSRDVVNVIGRELKTKKVGHCGTLDPFASGLLLIGVNKGTKILQFLESETKTYLATLKLGETTSTLDTEGEIIKTKPISDHNEEEIITVLKSFLGKSMQTPPIYSAIKVNGKALYKYARNNQEVDIKEREIEIFDINFVSYDAPFLSFNISCSKGTYIRTLGSDIANKLGEIGYLTKLQRTNIGNFSLNDAIEINNISYDSVISIVKSLSFLETCVLDEKQSKDIKDGKKYESNSNNDLLLLIDKEENPIAVYKRFRDNIFISLRGLF
ncbi:MAG: tRNA pseudouridine(55) synthase TruB [Bacilli bacterium]